jgi:hypothetical protein
MLRRDFVLQEGDEALNSFLSAFGSSRELACHALR